MQQGHISDVQIPKNLDATENILTREHEEVDHNANEKEGKEERPIHKALKAAPKMKKLALKSKYKQAIEQKMLN